jgi:hypothetical protein
LTSASENQLLPASGPKKSPARMIKTCAPAHRRRVQARFSISVANASLYRDRLLGRILMQVGERIGNCRSCLAGRSVHDSICDKMTDNPDPLRG